MRRKGSKGSIGEWNSKRTHFFKTAIMVLYRAMGIDLAGSSGSSSSTSAASSGATSI